jgi:hypothetical protein
MKLLIITALVVSGLLLPGSATANHTSEAILPDLAMLQPTDFHLERSGGSRRLLRFSTFIVNLGPGRFDVYGSNPDPADATKLNLVTQRLEQNGGWAEHPTEATMFYAGDGHDHWHVYGLQHWALAFAATPNEQIATGAKTGFCFWDNVNLRNAPKYYSGSAECHMDASGTVPMGLSPGWGDQYPWSIAFQYIDISHLPYGNYCLTVTADPLGQFVEVTKANNQEHTLISITKNGVNVLAANCGDTPATPTGLAATPGNGSVALDWDTSSDPVAGYNVYRDAGAEPIVMTTESAYTDTGLVNGINYCYAVTAIDGTGNESARSEAACATPTAGTASVHVADLDGSARAKGKSGRWEASVTVTVRDHGNAPVGGASVTGQWTGPASGAVAGTTAADGSVTFATGTMTSGTSVAFAVVNVSAGGSAYDPTANADPDGDSDGTTITVSRPF